MVRDHEEIVSCLRGKTVEDLSSYVFKGTPTFLTAMGPSRDGVLIPGDDGDDDDKGEFMADIAPKKRSAAGRKSNYSLLIGTVEDEVSHMFGDWEVSLILSKK